MLEIENRLYKYREYARMIEELEAQIDEIAELRDARVERVLNAPRWENTKVQGGERSDPVLDAVRAMGDVYAARIDGIRVRLADLYYLLDALKGDVAGAGLSFDERQYVEMRYFQGMRPGEIAQALDYSSKQMERVRKGALGKLSAQQVCREQGTG